MKARAVIAIIATGLVIGMVILGLSVAGSPSKARRLESDRTRVDRLAQLHYQLDRHLQTTGELPESLEELEGFEAAPGSEETRSLGRDPVTGKPFQYNKLSDVKYEICAEFAEDSEVQDAPYHGLGFENHRAGRQCFTQTLRRHPRDAIFDRPLRH